MRTRASTRTTRAARTALAVGAAASAVAVAAGTSPAAAGGAVVYGGDLVDLQPTQEGPLDGATAGVTLVERGASTHVTFRLQHIAPSTTARVFGAHLHTGPCVAGNGSAAGPHYNDDVIHGDTTPAVNRSTEVWLDFQVNAGGAGHALVSVPFAVEPGTRSIVVHASPTRPDGQADARLACIPVVVP